MFSDTKYTKWYFNIIENAKSKQHINYVEKHHNIPEWVILYDYEGELKFPV